MAERGGIARGIDVLRAAGLAERLGAAGDVHDSGDLALSEGDGVRGPSGLLNEAALAHLVVATRAGVASAHSQGHVRLLVGGDCPVLLGALAATRDRYGSCGLVHVDGHEDAWQPSLSPTGEASDSEVALALGLIAEPLPEPLGRLVPLLAPETVAMLGPRDKAEIGVGGASSLDGTVALFRSVEAIWASGAAASAAQAAAAVGLAARAFWLHLDLDVLRTDELAAVDYPQAGGLTWDELGEIGVAALAAPTCAGVSVVIYNPDKDSDGTGAHSIVRFLADLVAESDAARASRPH